MDEYKDYIYAAYPSKMINKKCIDENKKPNHHDLEAKTSSFCRLGKSSCGRSDQAIEFEEAIKMQTVPLVFGEYLP